RHRPPLLSGGPRRAATPASGRPTTARHRPTVVPTHGRVQQVRARSPHRLHDGRRQARAAALAEVRDGLEDPRGHRPENTGPYGPSQALTPLARPASTLPPATPRRTGTESPGDRPSATPAGPLAPPPGCGPVRPRAATPARRRPSPPPAPPAAPCPSASTPWSTPAAFAMTARSPG